MTACSWAAGWRSVLLRAYVDPPRVDEFKTPPETGHLIVLVTGGTCDIEARYRGRWQRTRYESGHIGMTGPGQEVALRWRPVAYRKALLGHNPRALGVLTLAIEKAGWGRHLPRGQGRGVSLQSGFGSYRWRKSRSRPMAPCACIASCAQSIAARW
jgi:hypothetical protein